MSLVYKGSGSEESNFLRNTVSMKNFTETAKEPAEFQKLLVNKSAKIENIEKKLRS
jgi:hypothetical protein